MFTSLPKPKHRTRHPNQVHFDVRASRYHVVGADLTEIHELDPYIAVIMITECSTDMTNGQMLYLLPNSQISGGEKSLSHSRKSNNCIVAHLGFAATNLGRLVTALVTVLNQMKGA